MTTARTKSIVTMDTVAKLAGVSRATVSIVFNKKPSGAIRVSDETRKHVESVLDRLGYRPDPIGRALVSGKSYLIGLLAREVSTSFFPSFVEAIEDEAEQHHYGVLVMTTRGDAKRQNNALKLMMLKRVDGLIFCDPGKEPIDPNILRDLRQQKTPLAYLGCCPETPTANTASIHVDGSLIGEIATRHLHDLGHRHIATVGVTKAIHQGMMRNVETHLTIEDWSFNPSHDEPMSEVIDRWSSMNNRPTAIFTNGDEYAIALLNLAIRRGIQIPKQLSILGVNNIPQAAGAIVPLSTIRQPKYSQGQKAAQVLFEMINGGQPTQVLLEPSLVARESTAPPAGILK